MINVHSRENKNIQIVQVIISEIFIKKSLVLYKMSPYILIPVIHYLIKFVIFYISGDLRYW